MNMNRSLRLAALVALVAGCGPLPLVSAKVQVAQICKTFADVPVPAAPYAVSGTISTTVPLDFSAEMSATQQQGVTSSVRLLSVKISPKTGVNDFGFLDEAKIDLSSSTGTTPVVGYRRDANAPTPAELDMVPATQLDLAQVAPSGQVDIVITTTGTLPTQAWSFDAEACFSADGSVEK